MISLSPLLLPILFILLIFLALMLFIFRGSKQSRSDQELFTIQLLTNQHDPSPRFSQLRNYHLLPETSIDNFRGIGSYRTTDGLVLQPNRCFRCGYLARTSETDRDFLRAIPIRTVIDLRTYEESFELPDQPIPGAIHYHIPITPHNAYSLSDLIFQNDRLYEKFKQAYCQTFLEAGAMSYAKIFKLLSNSGNLPVILHCTAGKDRTGVAVMLLMELLGVPDQTIISDYSLSNLSAVKSILEFTPRIQRYSYLGMKPAQFYPFFSAAPDYIQNALDYLRANYGSAEQYLIQKGGLNMDEIQSIRDNFLTPA